MVTYQSRKADASMSHPQKTVVKKSTAGISELKMTICSVVMSIALLVLLRVSLQT